MAESSSIKPQPPGNASEEITSQKQIIHLLTCIKEAHLLVWVKTSNLENYDHNSAIIGIDTNKNFITLDELSPEPTQPLSIGDELDFFAYLHGVDIHFTSTILDINNNGISYDIRIPKYLEHQQRREFFRVRVRVDTKYDIPIELTTDSKRKITGDLLDLSISGICIRFDSTIVTQIEAGQHLKGAQIILPDGLPLECNLEIRSIRYNEIGKNTLVGTKFYDLSPRDTNRIQSYINKIDRLTRKTTRHIR